MHCGCAAEVHTVNLKFRNRCDGACRILPTMMTKALPVPMISHIARAAMLGYTSMVSRDAYINSHSIHLHLD